jgi:hypothetical protein
VYLTPFLHLPIASLSVVLCEKPLLPLWLKINRKEHGVRRTEKHRAWHTQKNMGKSGDSPNINHSINQPQKKNGELGIFKELFS